MTVLFVTSLSVITISFALLICYLLSTITHSSYIKRTDRLSEYPKVVILKPVMGIDDNLETNIESFYLSDYPNFEIVFGIETEDDPCFGILKKVKAKYPGRKTKIIETGKDKELNPKIDTLLKLVTYYNSDCDLYWVADSSTRINRDTLHQLVEEYVNNDSKIVFSPILGTGCSSGGSIMRNSYLNTFVSGNIILAWNLFKEPIIVGKSMLIEKNTLNKLGGFNRFKEYLAEDYMMGEIYRNNKIKIATNFSWVKDYNCTGSVKDFFARTLRWAKMRFHINKVFYSLEILVNPLGMALVFSLMTGKNGIFLLLSSIFLKVILEYLTLFWLDREEPKKMKVILLYPFYVVLKDILLLFIYFIPLYDKTVAWRDKMFIIGYKSRIKLRLQ
ncbi:MAG: hypothetical protein LHV68_04160 [Elusimicrobia bacterium]|nr:hypothetical protein [Candidatus Liberimonas magnetica]